MTIAILDRPFNYLGSQLGVAGDDLKIVFVVLLSYPLSAILKRLPDAKPAQKNICLISISLFYLVGIFNLWSGIRTLFISSAGAYLIAAYVQGPLMPWIGFIFIMGHMSFTHLYRQWANTPEIVDISGAQMVAVMKLTAFCWNVYDGRFPDSELSEFQKDRAIRKMPNLLDFAGYVLYFPSLMAGPSFDYVEYKRWLDCSMFDTEALDKKGVIRKKRKIPRSGRPAAKKATQGLAWIGLFAVFAQWYTVDFVLGDNYMKLNIIRRIWYLYVLLLVARLKYYGIWSLTEGACILSGLGYNGQDPVTKQLKWDRVNNVDAFTLETGQNSRAVMEAWNKNTNKWLRYYVYLRVTPKGKKPGFRSSLATFTTSAFWHGFYPGYYLAFITASFVQTVAKEFRRNVRPFFLTPDGTKGTKWKVYYDVFGAVVMQATLAFMAAPFIILEFKKSFLVWSRVWFYVYVGIFAVMGFFQSPGRKWLSKQLKIRNGGVASAIKKGENIEPVDIAPFGIQDHQSLGRDVDEAVAEYKEMVQKRRQSASSASESGFAFGSSSAIPTPASVFEGRQRVLPGMGGRQNITPGFKPTEKM